MHEDGRSTTQPSRAVRWLVWSLFLTGWTAALLTPHPVSLAHSVLPEAAQFASFKLTHLGCYALLTVLSGWLRVAPRSRWLLLGFLSSHAFLTEFFQSLVPGRTPSLVDVAIDHLGILTGLALTWKWWLASAQRVGGAP